MFIEGDVGKRQIKSPIACRSTGRTCIQKGHNIRMTRRGKQRVSVHLGRQQEKFELKSFGFIKYIILNEKKSNVARFGSQHFRLVWFQRQFTPSSQTLAIVFVFSSSLSFSSFFLLLCSLHGESTFCGLNCNFYSCTLYFVAK